jgi:cytochrome c biogenesis protein CcdA
VSSRSLTNYAHEGQGPSVPELLSKLATESSHLVRDEIALAKQEIREQGVILRNGLVWAAVSASLGLAALLALCGAGAAALAPVVGTWQALLVVGGGLALISGIAVYASISILSRMALAPEQTRDTLEENKVWLKELA